MLPSPARLLRGGLSAALAFAISATAPSGVGATPAPPPRPLIDYPSFANTAGLAINGAATVVAPGNGQQPVLRLTPSERRQVGSVWSTRQIDVTRSFTATFEAYLHHGAKGADGIAFLVQSEGTTALGGWGGGIGYRGIQHSVAVEFDDFRNAPDPSPNHVAVVLGGNPDQHLAAAEAPRPLFGRAFSAQVVYQANSHRLRVSIATGPHDGRQRLLIDQSVDLAAQLGTNRAWVGFTGATGQEMAKQDINSWTVEARGA